MDRELQYHAHMVSQEKQAKAVKRMMLSWDGRETGAIWAGAVGRSFIPGRICPAAVCRRETF
ncbi:hypothetical protein WI604_28330 [Bradyrhizobium symbiodeficiens]|uniref:hypothetical protein n=1 Tax=Bradyrhizobium symbiodeficiens TaxID=1404367 RepID=UPI0030D245B9